MDKHHNLVPADPERLEYNDKVFAKKGGIYTFLWKVSKITEDKVVIQLKNLDENIVDVEHDVFKENFLMKEK